MSKFNFDFQIKEYVDDMCNVEPGTTIPARDLYCSYECWNMDSYPTFVLLDQPDFERTLDKASASISMQQPDDVWHGISTRNRQ
jgi:hypothetical protein